MPYEDGMLLLFDVLEKTIVVSFRDTIKMIGPFEDQRSAIEAGDKDCRDRGWANDEELFQAQMPASAAEGSGM